MIEAPPSPRPATGRSRRSLITAAAAALIGLAAVVFLARSLADQWSEVEDALLDANIGLMVAAVVLAGLAMAHLALLWGEALALLGHRAPRSRLLVWWFVGDLSKYLPGGVLSIVGRAEVSARGGARRTASYPSVPLSLALRYYAAILLFAALLPFDLADQRSSAALVMVLLVPVGLCLLHPRCSGVLLSWARRITKKPLDVPLPSWRQGVWMTLVYVPNWFLVIGATYCTARALTPNAEFLPIALATLLSWTIGFLAFPVPSGAGLREAVFVASCGLTGALAATIAIAARVVFVLVDGVGAAASLPWLHRKGFPVGPDAEVEGPGSDPATEPAPDERPVPTPTAPGAAT